MKNIREMDYIELDEFLNQDIKLTKEQFIDVKNNTYVDDYHFWGKGEYTIDISNASRNYLYSSVDVFVEE